MPKIEDPDTRHRKFVERRTVLLRWIRVLDMRAWTDGEMHLAMQRNLLRTPVDFYTHVWSPALAKDVQRTRVLSLTKFLRAIGMEQLNDSQAAKLRKHLGNIDKMVEWATVRGKYRLIKDHDLGKDALAHLYTVLSEQQDFIEAVQEHVDIC